MPSDASVADSPPAKPTPTPDSSSTTTSWDGPCQILALDGGGIKGLFSAAVLAKVEEKLDCSIVDHFDLITGTSTGGIIALGLGLGMRPRELVQFYVTAGPRIFSNRMGWRWWQQWVRRKYPQSPLRSALTDTATFGDKILGDSAKRLVIPAYDVGLDQVRVFKTPHHPRLKTDWQIPAWKVALATSAAPTYFQACQHIENTRLVDGGVWANNPTALGIAEAVSLLDCSLDQISVFSIGTTDTRVRRRRALDNGGILQWLRKKDVLDVLTRGQSVGTNGLSQHLIGAENLFRIDPVVPPGIYRLDKVNADELMAEAEHAALHASPSIEERFLAHAARPYKPCRTTHSERKP